MVILVYVCVYLWSPYVKVSNTESFANTQLNVVLLFFNPNLLITSRFKHVITSLQASTYLIKFTKYYLFYLCHNYSIVLILKLDV